MNTLIPFSAISCFGLAPQEYDIWVVLRRPLSSICTPFIMSASNGTTILHVGPDGQILHLELQEVKVSVLVVDGEQPEYRGTGGISKLTNSCH